MVETTRSGKSSGNDYQEIPNAHFPFWSRHPFLLNYELAALALGKEPEALKRAALKPEYRLHPIIIEYSLLLKLVDRAQLCDDLPEMISPDKGVEWLDRFELPCSNDFRSLVARYHPAPNWPKFSEEMFMLAFEKDQHAKNMEAQLDELQREKTEDIEEFKAWAENALQLIKEQDLEINHLCEAIASMEEGGAINENAANDNDNAASAECLSDLDPRLVTSLQKIIVGLAIAFCGYSPLSESNERSTSKELESVLAEVGLNLHWKTIEKVLVEARVRLSEQGLLKPWK